MSQKKSLFTRLLWISGLLIWLGFSLGFISIFYAGTYIFTLAKIFFLSSLLALVLLVSGVSNRMGGVRQ